MLVPETCMNRLDEWLSWELQPSEIRSATCAPVDIPHSRLLLFLGLFGDIVMRHISTTTPITVVVIGPARVRKS